MTFTIGLDIGQAQDHTALSVLRREVRASGRIDPELGEWHDDHYWVTWLERPPLKTAYGEIVTTVRHVLQSPKVQGKADLVVDATGVGRPIIEMLRAAGLDPIPVVITGGNNETAADDGFWHVPKKFLVSSLVLPMQTSRMHIVKHLHEAPTLQRELLAFKSKMTKHGNDQYEAFASEHDDLVLSVALATWWMERAQQGGWRPTPKSAEEAARDRRAQKWREEQERPWWARRTGTDRGAAAWWKK